MGRGGGTPLPAFVQHNGPEPTRGGLPWALVGVWGLLCAPPPHELHCVMLHCCR